MQEIEEVDLMETDRTILIWGIKEEFEPRPNENAFKGFGQKVIKYYFTLSLFTYLMCIR